MEEVETDLIRSCIPFKKKKKDTVMIQLSTTGAVTERLSHVKSVQTSFIMLLVYQNKGIKTNLMMIDREGHTTENEFQWSDLRIHIVSNKPYLF